MAEKVTYNDEARLRALLVGRRIVSTTTDKQTVGYDAGLARVNFTLDDGTVLRALETDGGCACSNGCWSVAAGASVPSQVITNVEVVDEMKDRYGDEATLRMYVYADGIKTEVLTSEGGDNGYYGWGYAVEVELPSDEAHVRLQEARR